MSKAKKSHVVRIYNSSKQLIQLQMRPPGSDFFTNESQVRIFPNEDVLLPKSHLLWNQIENLKKKGFIKVLHDSEAVEELQEALVNS
jgi:hypothetical protein